MDDRKTLRHPQSKNQLKRNKSQSPPDSRTKNEDNKKKKQRKIIDHQPGRDVIEISSDEEEKKPNNKTTKHSKGVNLPEINDPNLRRELEAQRLARQLERQRNDQRPSSSSSKIPTEPPIPPPIINDKKNDQNRFWNSAIRKTFNNSYPDWPNALRIEDIVGQKDEIRLALISSYVVDLDWIESLFATGTRIVVVKHGEEAGTFRADQRSNMFICHPPLLKNSNGKLMRGCMHVKFFIIYYNNFCRVVIPTANAVDFDYETIENAVWIQDFPILKDQESLGNHKNNDSDVKTDVCKFKKRLEHLIEKMNVPSVFVDTLSKFDFSSAKASLVISIQGSHPIQSCSYGKIGLAKELGSLGLSSGPGTGHSLKLECQGSSIGSYDEGWLKNFYSCASGSLDLLLNSFKNSKKTSSSRSTSELPDITVVFPTLETVKNSLGGIQGGGTIFCNKSTWDRPGYPREIFADSISKRPGLLMHVKMILGIFEKDEAGEKTTNMTELSSKLEEDRRRSKDPPIGFLYVGSHNFTPAAWGKVSSKKSSSSSDQLEISNWELGVIVPIFTEYELNEKITWKRPVKKYGHSGGDSKVPWMQFLHNHPY